MIAPMIHINGDRKNVLQSEVMTCYSAVGEAIDELQKACPNARNYYTISPTSFEVAVFEHSQRLKKLQEVRNELMALYIAIDEGKTSFQV